MRPAGDIRIYAGQLRHPLQINQFGPTSPPTTNAAGQAMTWTPFVPMVMGFIGPERATLDVKNGQQVTLMVTPITIRYLPGVNASMQIVSLDTGDVYQIQGIVDVDRRRVVMEINCTLFGNANSPTSSTASSSPIP